jgi:hypothetical protein
MSLHSDTLFWFRANQSLLFLFNAACLAEKQQLPILKMVNITHFHWIEFGGPVAEYHINCLCTELCSLLCILSSWRFYVVAMAINGYPGMETAAWIKIITQVWVKHIDNKCGVICQVALMQKINTETNDNIGLEQAQNIPLKCVTIWNKFP